jgi:hypothetical protein
MPSQIGLLPSAGRTGQTSREDVVSTLFVDPGRQAVFSGQAGPGRSAVEQLFFHDVAFPAGKGWVDNGFR